MTPETAMRLLALNRQFYDAFAGDFSNTRRGIPPGMQRLLSTIPAKAAVLDLGCGNGRAAAFLTKNGHCGGYTGLDASERLLNEARCAIPATYRAEFIQADLSTSNWENCLPVGKYDILLAFAVLHHIPSYALRLRFVQAVQRRLAPQGRLLLSNWQFLNSARLRARIQSWDKAGLSNDDVDEGDYLLDWRQGGSGLRYVHHFTNASLEDLAGQAGFHVCETFLSDGEGGNLSLYQVWEYN
jgi:tRNA (uracil-5-)-methyltransferase TRM9